jgi:hypothetical protein
MDGTCAVDAVAINNASTSADKHFMAELFGVKVSRARKPGKQTPDEMCFYFDEL